MAALNQIEHERSRADFQGGRPLAHVGVAQDHVKAPVTAGIDMRFVARVDQRPAIHRVDADHHAEKICALRNLINSRLTRSAFSLHAHFAGASENLTGNQERQNRADDPVPRHIALHQIIVVAAVAVSEEIGVVFVEADFLTLRQLQIPPPRAFSENPLARFVLGHNLVERRALRRRIFRMGVIVVEARSIAQYQVALDFVKGQGALRVLGEIIGFVTVLEQFLDSKSARVAMRVFAAIIPAHADAGGGGAADQSDGLGNDVEVLRDGAADANLGFGPELYVHRVFLLTPTFDRVDFSAFGSGDEHFRRGP